MRCATRRGCSTKLVVESMTPGMRILSSGILIALRSSHSWSWRGLAASMLNACTLALNAISMILVTGRSWVCGQPVDRGVERGDIALGDFCAEFVIAEMAVLVVARRAEVGRVDLQHEAGLDDGAVFDLEHIGERCDISLLGRVMQVDDEARQNARRRRGHEHLGRPRLCRRGFEMGKIAVERRA